MRMSSFLKKGGIVVAIVGSIVGLQSCLDDDNNYYEMMYPNALVTVKPNADGSFFLQLDDSTTLLPTNLVSSPYGNKEVRALTNFEFTEDESGIYDRAVYINWMDSILTKPMAADLGEQNDSIYGTDPVEILNDWVTIAEDGYLTLRFASIWTNNSKPHFVNLLSGRNPDDPYEVEFRHNAYGDVTGPDYGWGMVAFKLDSLPDTQGETVKLTLKWKSFEGTKSTQFDYCTRESTVPQNSSIANVRSTMRMK